jgi:hypothetical protein
MAKIQGTDIAPMLKILPSVSNDLNFSRKIIGIVAAKPYRAV